MTWTCLTCFNDYTGTPMRCAVCYEPLCENCRHQHTKQEIRAAALLKLDVWLQELHHNHPIKFCFLTAAAFAVVIIPILLLVMFR